MDTSEYNNLAESRPDKVKELLKLYESWNANLAPAQWGEGEQYVEIRRKEYIRFRDSREPLSLQTPKELKKK
jgi:hypothetical protein